MVADGDYAEEELISHFLDDESRLALARGKEKLARERATASGTVLSQEHIVHDPTVTASSTDVDVAATTIPST